MSEEEKPQAVEAAPAPDMVPSARLREETTKRNEATASRDAALASLVDLQTKFEALSKTSAAASDTHAQDLALYGAGVTDNEVRDFVRSRYEPVEGSTFGDWLAKQQAEPSPLLAPFLGGRKEASAPAPEPAPEVKAAPKTNKGAAQPASHSSQQWSNEEIKTARSKHRGGLGSSKDEILAQLRAEGLIS
tara:strand:- start:255 stop:824 length:570 start_codon:yes stop_codon:yes gene_type:complete